MAVRDDDDFEVIGQCTVLATADGNLRRTPGTIGANQPLTPEWNTRPPRGKGFPVVCVDDGEPYRSVPARTRRGGSVCRAIVGGQDVRGVGIPGEVCYVGQMKVIGLVSDDPEPKPKPVLSSGLVSLLLLVVWFIFYVTTFAAQVIRSGGVARFIAGLVVGGLLVTLLGSCVPSWRRVQQWRREHASAKAARAFGVPVYANVEEAQGDWGFVFPSDTSIGQSD